MTIACLNGQQNPSCFLCQQLMEMYWKSICLQLSSSDSFIQSPNLIASISSEIAHITNNWGIGLLSLIFPSFVMEVRNYVLK
jgi:hypothetical protein